MDTYHKKFVIPTAELIHFLNNDIITYSKGGTAGDDWRLYPDAEEWDD